MSKYFPEISYSNIEGSVWSGKITDLTFANEYLGDLNTETDLRNLEFYLVAASYLGFPISTTHTLVGGLIGVSLAKGAEHLDFASIKRIIASWLVTIPAGAAFTVLFYILLRIIFGV